MTADWADHCRQTTPERAGSARDRTISGQTWRRADHLASPRLASPRLASPRLASQHLARPRFACASSERLPSHFLRAPFDLRAPLETLLAVLLQLVGIRTEEEALLH